MPFAVCGQVFFFFLFNINAFLFFCWSNPAEPLKPELERDNRLSSLSDINHTAWSDYCLLDQWSARECLQAKTALSAIIFNSKGQKYCAAYSCSCPRSRLTSQKSQKSFPFRRRVGAIHRVVTARASGTFEKNPIWARAARCAAQTPSRPQLQTVAVAVIRLFSAKSPLYCRPTVTLASDPAEQLHQSRLNPEILLISACSTTTRQRSQLTLTFPPTLLQPTTDFSAHRNEGVLEKKKKKAKSKMRVFSAAPMNQKEGEESSALRSG